MDEPLLTLAQPPASDHGQPALPERIRGLLEAQHYGVLCTQGGGQPYGSLVAFAFDEALTQLFFATPVTTRKFHLLSACDRVAMVVDSRASHGDELTRVEAVTVTGRADCPSLVRTTPSVSSTCQRATHTCAVSSLRPRLHWCGSRRSVTCMYRAFRLSVNGCPSTVADTAG